MSRFSRFTALLVRRRAQILCILAGVILYGIFHLRWWDYSDYKFNLNGFICLRFSIYWGIACSLGMYMLHPAVMSFIHWMSPLARQIVLLVLIINTIVDIIVTVTAIVGFNKKIRFLNNVSDVYRMPSNKIGSSIYGTVDTIVKQATPAVQMTQNDYKEFTEIYAAHRKAERELAGRFRAREIHVGPPVEAFKILVVRGKRPAFHRAVRVETFHDLRNEATLVLKALADVQRDEILPQPAVAPFVIGAVAVFRKFEIEAIGRLGNRFADNLFRHGDIPFPLGGCGERPPLRAVGGGRPVGARRFGERRRYFVYRHLRDCAVAQHRDCCSGDYRRRVAYSTFDFFFHA